MPALDLLSDDAPASPSAAPTPAPAAAPSGAPPSDTLPDPASKAFLDMLPADLRGSPSLSRYSSPEALARAYLNAERMIGSEKVPIPKDDSDQEAWDRYYKAGGRPDQPTAYEFERPQQMPEGVFYDEAMEQWWKQSAFEAGLSKRQANKLYEQYRDRFFAQTDAYNRSIITAATNAKMELQRDWGPEYEAKRVLARAAFEEMPPELREHFVSTGAARMPSFVKYLYDIKAKTTGEREPRPPGGQGGGQSPDGMRQLMSEFRKKHHGALMDVTHPDHDHLLRELTRLNEQLYPEGER